MSIINNVFKRVPVSVQNCAITLFNTRQYKIRHGGKYKKFRKYYKKVDGYSQKRLDREFISKRDSFFSYVKKHSSWYKDYNFDDLKLVSILEKQDIINYFDEIKTIDEKKGIVSLTGGTTGTSMKVIYTKSDMQERFALLDHFREKNGYKLGKKTAWFSGKNLISEADITKGLCSHYDFINKIRFYSTFHINEENFDMYWSSLNKFKPEFIVGFPSSVYEICEIADSRGLSLKYKVKVFFPTAETVLPQHRDMISRVLGCKLVNQYASSEGAPFILECEKGNLHIHPLTGVFEVVDEDMQPATEGEVLVTSFTTKGTPLIRYRIGDSIKLAPQTDQCECLSHFPLVERIYGRTDAYIYSPDKGLVNLNRLSIFTKQIQGLIATQVIQKSKEAITLNMVVNNKYDQKQESRFISLLRELIGESIDIDIQYLDSIPREKSGKFRFVKNSLKI
ncbi:phenylacetate--CoA ligase family protein [Psychrobacter pacificensis]|uniref:phenylacetate--CoA ligase family protein n=1 Tax=Psychrobacter pacificensis TaxID=112002 RepID=UPI003D03EC07